MKTQERNIYRPIAAQYEPFATRESSRPRSLPDKTDFSVDVVVVGSGCGGLTTALFSAWRGLSVLVIEKAPEIGGTTRKSAFWTWVPNNDYLRENGISDNKEEFLKYCLKTARPENYNPNMNNYGVSDREYDLVSAIYDNTWPAVKELHDKNGLRFRYAPSFMDYLGHLNEDAVPFGRVMVPEDSNSEMTNGGLVAIENLSAACLQAGVQIIVGHRVQRLLLDSNGNVGGVEASTVDAIEITVKAKKGVVFASGGFTHDPELVKNYLSFPSLGGCAARTNEGDFVRIASAVGAQLGNMQFAWRSAVPVEPVLAKDPHMNATTSWPGDSMIGVNLKGERCLNEKLPYNELAVAMGQWDPRTSSYPNLYMIQIWDERCQKLGQAESNGSIVPEGFHKHVFKADTLEAWTNEVERRFASLAEKTGGVQITEGFLDNLRETISRWNSMSQKGKDLDYGRGDISTDIDGFGGPLDENSEFPNPVMHPISLEGPFYGALVTAGTLDTKGGPLADTKGRILDDLGEPIPGLFGVGNCVAAVQGRSYWAGGATLGPMIAFAHKIAGHLAAE